MARSRNIKPKIMGNEDLADLEPLARLLFVYLWMLADRDGRLEDRPRRIAAEALPYDRDADVDGMLNALAIAGFILRYRAAGAAIIQIVNFAKHQTPHVREAASELPAHDQADADSVQSTTKAMPKHDLGSVEASPRSPDCGLLIPDSLIVDSPAPAVGAVAGPLPAEVKPEKRKRKPKAPEITFAEFATACRAAGEPAVPEDDPIHAWAESAGVTTEMITLCWAKFRGKYTDSDKLYADWRATFRNAVRDNWFRLWYVADDGQIRLTTNGRITEKVAA